MSFRVRPSAAADLDEVRLWYERQQPGLGSAFAGEVTQALRAILAHPEAGARVTRRTRRWWLRRFPYALYYHHDNDLIVLVACLHGRRAPRPPGIE